MELHGNGTIWRDNSTITEPLVTRRRAAHGLRNSMPVLAAKWLVAVPVGWYVGSMFP